MNASAVARHYGNLTAEERFRLILAASGRGDEAERDRLGHAGGRITLSMPDHSPYAHAFSELAHLTFIELLEEAARYRDVQVGADEAFDLPGEEDDEGEQEEGEDEAEGSEDSAEAQAEEVPAGGDWSTKPLWQSSLELVDAAGFVLRTKAGGWKLFCERMNVPPFLLWKALPGFDRLQSALTLTEKAAFTSEGFLPWLNRIRPAGKPELIEVPLTVERVARQTEEMFRERVKWWGG
jgi:hypothetical protein